MLHPIKANWTSSGDGYAGMSSAAPAEDQAVSSEGLIKVSSAQSVALFEHQAKPQLTAVSLQGSRFEPQHSIEASLYSMDTAVMALALFGAWMMVVGGAMLSRRVSQIKSKPLQRQ